MYVFTCYEYLFIIFIAITLDRPFVTSADANYEYKIFTRNIYLTILQMSFISNNVVIQLHNVFLNVSLQSAPQMLTAVITECAMKKTTYALVRVATLEICARRNLVCLSEQEF